MSPSSSPGRPLITIAIAAGDGARHTELIDRLAESGLLGQSGVEICVAYSGGYSRTVETAVRSIHCPVGTPLFQLYGRALAETDSLYVGLLDADCPPAPGWLDAVLREARAGKNVLYGPVDPGWPADDPRIVGYLVEYAQFQSPLDQALGEYPGNNIAFRRELLETAPPDHSGFQKTFFLRRLESESGIRPEACEDMVVIHRKAYPWRHYLRRRLHHGRLYGSSHARTIGGRRFLYAAGTPILPAIRYWRILRAAQRHPDLRNAVVRFSGRVLASELAWSVGEWQGYMLGPPREGAALD